MPAAAYPARHHQWCPSFPGTRNPPAPREPPAGYPPPPRPRQLRARRQLRASAAVMPRDEGRTGETLGKPLLPALQWGRPQLCHAPAPSETPTTTQDSRFPSTSVIFPAKLTTPPFYLGVLVLVWTLYEFDDLESIIDRTLKRDFDTEEALWLLKIGLVCIPDSPKIKPSMSMVAKMLQATIKFKLYGRVWMAASHATAWQANDPSHTTGIGNRTLIKSIEVQEADKLRRIVLDAPSTGHTLKLLSVSDWIEMFLTLSIKVASNNSGLENFRQFHHILAPPSSDPGGNWSRCKSDPGGCSATQIATLQGLRSGMLTSLRQSESKPKAGVFINSCFAHC
ncbi:Pectin acetylesterase 9 [Zea mays]|uniref:Pectin acetylesterase n=1 Tax=Zea mays TaxID=4577 RepID=A0A1D6NME3_MAIZE|nr:Pectin acetylesterase 9 [Zea mays]